MTNGEKLYKAICEKCCLDDLNDEEIEHLALSIQERFGELGNLSDVRLTEIINVEPDAS